MNPPSVLELSVNKEEGIPLDQVSAWKWLMVRIMITRQELAASACIFLAGQV